MKKLILLIGMLIMIATLSSNAQGIMYYNFGKQAKITLTTFTVDKDTVYRFKRLDPTVYNFDFFYTGLDANDAYAKVYTSMDTARATMKAVNIDSIRFDQTITGSGSIASPNLGFMDTYVFIKIFNESCTAGEVYIIGNLQTKY